VLLVSPYYMHRVEALDATVSMAYNYATHETHALDEVNKVALTAAEFIVNGSPKTASVSPPPPFCVLCAYCANERDHTHNVYNVIRCHRTHARTQAVLRVLAKSVIKTVLALQLPHFAHHTIKAFLLEQWQDWEMLPDREDMGYATDEGVSCELACLLTPTRSEREGERERGRERERSTP